MCLDVSLVEVLRGHALGADRFVAFTRLVGDFPCGTVELADRFTLRDLLIAKLEIAATDPTGDRWCPPLIRMPPAVRRASPSGCERLRRRTCAPVIGAVGIAEPAEKAAV